MRMELLVQRGSGCVSSLPMPNDTAPPSAAATLALVMVGSLVVFAAAVIGPALPAMQAHFAEDPRASAWVPLLVTTPALSVALSAHLAGYLLDRFGRHAAVLAALVGFAAFGTAGAFDLGLDGLLWTRAGLGLCIAFLTAGFTALVGDLFDPPARAAIMGRQVGVNALMAFAMTLTGGLLSEWHWRGVFLVYLAALPIAAMFVRFVPRRPPGAPGRRSQPADDNASAHWPTLVGVYALALLCPLTFALLLTRGPFLVQSQYGGSATVIALALAAATLGGLPTALLFGRLHARWSSWPSFALGFALMAAGLAGQSLAPSLALMVTCMGLTGAGFGLVMPNLSTTLLGAAPAALRGRLSGGLVSVSFAGQFLSPLLSQPLVQRHGIEAAFLAAAALLTATALACLIPSIGRRYTRTRG